MKRPLTRSFAFALRGLWVAIKTERNARLHLIAALAAVGTGVYLGLPAVEWGLVIFAIGSVLASELFNTAIERLCDDTSGGKKDHGIKNCKDISAAAVLLSAAAALIIGIIILIIPLFQKLFG